MNVQRAQKVLQKLASAGVKEVVFCPGGRNAPFLHVLEKTKNIKVHYFFEERSAAFFALGRAKVTSRPVAVFTTSGTAVAELLPACIESYYSGEQLIFVTADRPASFRGTGAPQSIEQLEILKPYVDTSVDIDEKFDANSLSIGERGNVHCNVQFDEPLIDAEVEIWDWCRISVEPQISAEKIEIESKTERAINSPLLVIGHLPEEYISSVRQALQGIDAPIYCEAGSGLRGEFKNEIKSGDKYVSRLIEEQKVDAVIRVGGVPTLRTWRDLEKKYVELQVLHFSHMPFSGLARESTCIRPLEQLSGLQGEFKEDTKEKIVWMENDLERKTVLDKILLEESLSEASFFRKISNWIECDQVFVGNSLPIRQWDLCASFDRNIRTYVNRGANGIDGQISTFLGTLNELQIGCGVFGDLTTMYDLSAPWILQKLKNLNAQVVVVNNQGGQIFSRLFKSKKFLNEHEINFSHWAKMWGLDYCVWDSEFTPQFSVNSSRVIEVRPCSESTKRFWQKYDELLK